jgi:uncharacterized membrane protein YhhN
MNKIAVGLYLIVGVVNVVGHALDMPDLVRYSKPMLMPALIYLVYEHAKGRATARHMLLLLALVFSWVGDLMLMQPEEQYFLLGLGAFLLAQLTYVYIYWISTYQRPELRLTPLLPILTFTIFLLAFLIPRTGDMKIPIVFYAVCITGMACMARLRAGLTSNQSFQWVMLGSVLFVISDSTIAINKFVQVVPMSGLIIMATYIAAQILIAVGLLKHAD